MPIDVTAVDVPKSFCFSKDGVYNRFTDLDCKAGKNGTYTRNLECCKLSESNNFTACTLDLANCKETDKIYNNNGTVFNPDQQAFYDLNKNNKVLNCDCSGKVGIMSDWQKKTGEDKNKDSTYNKIKMRKAKDNPYCVGDDRSEDNKSRYQFSCPESDKDTYYVRSMDKCCTMDIQTQLQTDTLSSGDVNKLLCDEEDMQGCTGDNIIRFVKNFDNKGMYSKSSSNVLYDYLLCDNNCDKVDNRKIEK